MIRLYVNGALCEEIPQTIPGFNHVGLLVDAGELHLTHFSSKAKKPALQTGISY
jgi:hypothetical protein